MANSVGIERIDAGWPSVDVDTTVPHPARVYDFWLGGKDNFAADRALAESIMQWVPVMPAKVRVNRAFLGRAVRYLAEVEGIRQFLDVGAGLPTARNTHQVAQEIEPSNRVLYVDNDPVVVAHARALMASNGPGMTGFEQADLRNPDSIMYHPAFARTLDLTQPVGVLMLAVLMLIPDDEHPYEAVSKLMTVLPPGSYLAVTHLTADVDPAGVGGLVAAAEQQGSVVVARRRAEVEEFFAGMDMITPGVVPVTSWRPEPEGEISPEDQLAGTYAYAAVGRKPR
ncbi:MAG: SAM-dependent methyltransferase [Sporichthyaceae bacterium]|nr:SAM-dependent methyltransferase [Sporichthyaceae bacterium]